MAAFKLLFNVFMFLTAISTALSIVPVIIYFTYKISMLIAIPLVLLFLWWASILTVRMWFDRLDWDGVFD